MSSTPAKDVATIDSAYSDVPDGEILTNVREAGKQTIALNREYIRQQRSLGQLDAMTRHRDPTPDDLLPRTGGAALQVTYYSSVHITDMKDEGKGLTPLDGPIGLTTIGKTGFTRPAVGVRITTEQSWEAKGVTLGHLLHSISLAPGEATKVAVMDWSRRESGRRQETTDQSESQTATNDQNTVQADVVNSVANELQFGSSTNTASGSSAQQGGASGGLFGGLFGSNGSSGGSINSGVATNVGFSAGTKNVNIGEVARIQGLTHQAASAVRGRRAGTVEETSSTEGQTASTRVLVNYNHMHTLNIMYYEVVENFKVVTKNIACERVLFVPFQPYDFTLELVATHMMVLRRAAALKGAEKWKGELDSLISNDTDVLKPSDQLIVHLNHNRLFYSSVIWGNADALTLSHALSGYSHEGRPLATSLDLNPIAIAGNYLGFLWPFAPDKGKPIHQEVFTVGDNPREWPVQKEVVKLSLSHMVVRPEDGAWNYATANFLTQVRFTIVMVITTKDGNVTRHELTQRGFYRGSLKGKSSVIPIFTDRIETIAFEVMSEIPTLSYNSLLNCAITVDLTLSDGSEIKEESSFTLHRTERAGYFGSGAPFLSVKTIFAPSASDRQREWELQFAGERFLETEIPMGTGGIFAEAVLGRSNSAEKLDLTRFWNWQDSPIPILPPDISPVDVSSRYQQSNLSTHALEENAAVLQQFAQAPALQGMMAVSEIMKANIFRDMSGAKEAAENASKALEQASKGADGAAKTAMDGQKEAMKHVSDLIGKAMDAAQTAAAPEATAAKGAGAKGPGGNISEKGAAANIEEVASAGSEAEGGGSAEGAEELESEVLKAATHV